MLKIAVLGVGHLGEIHLKLLQNIKAYEIVGFYDPNNEKAEKVRAKYGVKRFTCLDKLLEITDVVDIVTPTINHFELAKKAIELKKHVFIEKPLCHTLAEAEMLVKLVHKYGVKAQVGHVERFNPAYLATKKETLQPKFIETHRLAMFNPRGNDVSVVLDLMIHDLDIILNIVKSPVKSVQANGMTLVTNFTDIANARIVFENDCVANVTANRVAMENRRKTCVFQDNDYISIDFLHKERAVMQLSNQLTNDAQNVGRLTKNKTKSFTLKQADVKANNAIEMELSLFAESIINNSIEAVTVKEGFDAMKLAYQILNEIELSTIIPINNLQQICEIHA